ncbi:MAG: LemA family protein [Muribaculaceae bacterium]|nr:LemA family protein [Muribaculaceae bacterium]
MNYKKFIVPGVIIIVLLLLVGWYVSVRNNLVTIDEGVENQWAKVEVQYQRRMDLIPSLVETVKGYAKHESETFENVTRARAGLTDAYNAANALQGGASEANTSEEALDQYNNAQQSLGRALSIYVNAVREAYPDLKADTQFTDLQTQLEGTENRIATERGRYTDVVKEYNVTVRRFPASIVASISGFAVKPQFKADAQASQAPKFTF